MTVLSMIQSVCQLHALAVPTSVIGNTTTTTIQMYAILDEVIEELVKESKFNVTTQEAVFISIAAQDQGAMTTLATKGYTWAYLETFFDRTLRRSLYGPLTETEWQEIQALPNPGPFYKFRIWQDHLWINPAPTTPFSTIAFEYASSWAIKSAGGTLKAAITADTDVCVFPEDILKRGVIARWKQIKGLPYQYDEEKYYALLNNYIARDKVKRRIDLSHPQPVDIRPGVFVPSGNWNV